jgi:hypothetical protein
LRRAALAALLLLAGCGGAAKRPATPATAAATEAPAPPTDEQRIGKLLQRRARALTRDRAVAELKLRRPHYVIHRIRVRGNRARIATRLEYRVRGVKGEFGSERTLLARKRNRRWRIARALGDRDADPWEVDDYVRAASPHFVIFTPSDIFPPSDALEVGYMRLQDLLPHAPLKDRYLAVVARDGEHARQLTRDIEGLESLTALTDTQLGPGTEIASQRLIIVQSQFGLNAVESQQAVITHELTHATLARFSSGRTPAWLVEGVALYVSADDRRGEYAALPTVPTLAALSVPDAIAGLDGERQRAAYATSSAAAFLIADRYGREKLLELYRAFAKPGPRRGSATYSDRVLKRVLGVGIDELQRTLG